MNKLIEKLQPYPFEKLASLKEGLTPRKDLRHIPLSIGEPKHPAPAFVLETLADALEKVEVYPTTRGSQELRQSMAKWCEKRFSLNPGSIDPESSILPVSGTREALFSFAQSCLDTTRQDCLVLAPNPFYQIYEGAALLAGARLEYLNCTANNHFKPDFSLVSEESWKNCQLVFLCTPGNPTGAVIDLHSMTQLINLSDKYNFIIASDECYSELYRDENSPPPGILQACASLGRHNYRNCVAFHSLSKRSNLPGLRSGFVAGDTSILKEYFKCRTYFGSAQPVPTQIASMVAWQDEEHVKENRLQYNKKYQLFKDILSDLIEIEIPDGSFYLWLNTPINDETFAKLLFQQQNVTVLPGSYLSRTINGTNPGANRVRIALVATIEECADAANRIKQLIDTL